MARIGLLLIGLLLMPAPTSGLTGQFDASVVTDLYQAFSGGLLNTHPALGGAVNFWKSHIDPSNDTSTKTFAAFGTSPNVTWAAAGPLRLPSIRITNGKLRTQTAGGLGQGFDNYMSRTAAAMLLAFRIDSASIIPNSTTGGGGQLYFNATLIGGERNTYWSVYVRKDGSQAYLVAYNWDGSADTIEIPISLDASHVLCMRHEAGSLFLSVDCGAEQTVASGTTDNSTTLNIGDQGVNSGTTAEVDGWFGETLFYNVGDAATALAASEYLCDKWLSPEIVDQTDPTLPDHSCDVASGGGQSAGGCVVAYPTIGTQDECDGGGLVPEAADLVHSETWWGNA